MAKPNSSYEELARDAAARLNDAQAHGQQLTFLHDEPKPGETAKAARGKGKATSQLRDWLAVRGLRLPEDVITEMAGLASSGDAMLTAMAAAEKMMAWAQAGAASEMAWVNEAGEDKKRALRTEPTLAERVEAFKFFYTIQLRAAEALLPYGLAKITPDVAVPQAVQVVVMPGGGAAPASAQARDVTPQDKRLGPPPMPWEMPQNQQVSDADVSLSDVSDRTEGAKR